MNDYLMMRTQSKKKCIKKINFKLQKPFTQYRRITLRLKSFQSSYPEMRRVEDPRRNSGDKCTGLHKEGLRTCGTENSLEHCSKIQRKADCWCYEWTGHGETSWRRKATENMYDVLVSYSPLFIKWPANDFWQRGSRLLKRTLYLLLA